MRTFGYVLDRADRVQSHRGRGRDRAARLDADARLHAERLACIEQHVAPLCDGGRLLPVHIGDAEATPEHEFGQIERNGEVGHHLSGLRER